MEKNFIENAGLKFLFGILLTVLVMALPANSFAEVSSVLALDNPDGSQTLQGHVPGVVKNFQAVFKNHASRNIDGRVILPLGNTSQLISLLKDLYDPQSPSFHQFLTPTQFAQQFSPSAIDSIQVQEFLKKEGISVTGKSSNGTVLNVTGSVRAFEQAFGLHINNYQNSDGTIFYAPDANPTIPAELAGKISAIGGLDNLAKYMAHRHRYQGNVMPQIVGTGPLDALSPKDVKTAYNLNAVPANGSGQNIALFELDGYAPSDITAYESNFSLPKVPLQNVLIDGFTGTPQSYADIGGGAQEVTLDIELLTGFVPGSKNIYVYEAYNSTNTWIDEWNKIANDDIAKVISCSWGISEVDSPTISNDNAVFMQMAAQGQAVFVSSGDYGAVDGDGAINIDEPAAQPYVTAVGISILTTNANGSYGSEVASHQGGGGVSVNQSIPSYQLTAAANAVSASYVSTTMRNVPDVVLTADPSTPYAFYIQGSWSAYWGSSIAAPVWASFISLVNQGLGQNGPIGSVNSALYQIAQSSSSYASDFHDIISGNNIYYPAEVGFDDASGLGSFNGLNLYNDLVNMFKAVNTPSAPTGLTAAAGPAQVVLKWTASSGATSYNVYRSTTSTTVTGLIGSVVTLNGTLTGYTDNNVYPGTAYYYKVSAVNPRGASSGSLSVSAIPLASLPVAAVKSFTGIVCNTGSVCNSNYASNYAGIPGILLQWVPSSSPNVLYNKVYRSTANGTPAYYGSIPATTSAYGLFNIPPVLGQTSFYDLGVISGTSYNYYVTAVNYSGVESPVSGKVTVSMN